MKLTLEELIYLKEVLTHLIRLQKYPHQDYYILTNGTTHEDIENIKELSYSNNGKIFDKITDEIDRVNNELEYKKFKEYQDRYKEETFFTIIDKKNEYKNGL